MSASRKKAAPHPAGGNPIGTGATSASLKRVNYFEGQILSAADFKDEQNYHLEKRRLHNRMLFGAGVVSGLEVAVDPTSSGNRLVITVSPGFAIDREGNELAVSQPLRCTLQAPHTSGYIVLSYHEKLTDFVPVAGGTSQASRIVEESVLESSASDADLGVALARMLSANNKWKLDRKFRPRRIRR